MKKAVYKITNNVNKKIYIGISKHPEQRWKEHCYRKEKYASLINKAINKYGKDNFSFEIIGWFNNAEEKEIELINQYRSLVPYGYNIHKGGNVPPLLQGENNPHTNLSEETITNIQKDMLNYSISRQQIIKKYHITQDIFRHINEGSSWRKDNLTYPLRPTEKELKERKADMVKDLLINSNLSQKEIGRKVGWNHSAITMINIGKNHYDKNLTYPLREGRHY